MLTLLLLCTAEAGSGPWTLSEGSWTLYGGTEYRHFGKVVGGEGSFSGDANELGTGVRSLSVQAIGSYGLLDPAELELVVPFIDAQADRPDDASCDNLGMRACKRVQALGLVTTRLKLRALDELRGAPFTLTLFPKLRYGEATHAERARLTAPTEGQTDVGGGLVLGRSGALGDGYQSAWILAEYRHRIANATLDGRKVPGDEVAVEAQFLWSPVPAVSFGPEAWFVTRGGVDLEDMDYSDPDRFASLGVTTLTAGGKVVLRSSRRWSAILGASGTVYARNNPPDAFSISVGISHLWLPVDG